MFRKTKDFQTSIFSLLSHSISVWTELFITIGYVISRDPTLKHTLIIYCAYPVLRVLYVLLVITHGIPQLLCSLCVSKSVQLGINCEPSEYNDNYGCLATKRRKRQQPQSILNRKVKIFSNSLQIRAFD